MIQTYPIGGQISIHCNREQACPGPEPASLPLQLWIPCCNKHNNGIFTQFRLREQTEKDKENGSIMGGWTASMGRPNASSLVSKKGKVGTFWQAWPRCATRRMHKEQECNRLLVGGESESVKGHLRAGTREAGTQIKREQGRGRVWSAEFKDPEWGSSSHLSYRVIHHRGDWKSCFKLAVAHFQVCAGDWRLGRCVLCYSLGSKGGYGVCPCEGHLFRNGSHETKMVFAPETDWSCPACPWLGGNSESLWLRKGTRPLQAIV